jgi:hypothetical protein
MADTMYWYLSIRWHTMEDATMRPLPFETTVAIKRIQSMPATTEQTTEFERVGQYCPILGLPPELRVLIYRYTFDGEEYVDIKPGKSKSISWQSPALLRTCYVIREEAESVYFSSQRFKISLKDIPGIPSETLPGMTLLGMSYTRARMWMGHIGRHNVKRLRHIHLDGAPGPYVVFFTMWMMELFRRTIWDQLRAYLSIDKVSMSTRKVRDDLYA